PSQPASRLCPYTTLFRSQRVVAADDDGEGARLRQPGHGLLDGGQTGLGLRPQHVHVARVDDGHAGQATAAAFDVKEAVGSQRAQDRKSTRLNSSHVKISY